MSRLLLLHSSTTTARYLAHLCLPRLNSFGRRGRERDFFWI